MIPPSTTITAEGRRLRRFLLIAGAILIGGNLIAFALGQILPDQRVGGPAGSSYVTTAYGTAAWAELLVGEGQTVTRLRGPYTPERLPADHAVILVETGFTSVAGPELMALRQFLEAGGHFLMAGPKPGDLIDAIATDPPRWTSPGSSSASGAGAEGRALEGRVIPLGGVGSFTELGEADAFLADEDGSPLAVSWMVGAGTVFWLADATPLLNGGLADGDSAALAVAMTSGRPVIFDEFRHGFGGDSLWQSLPDRWANTIALLAVAGVVALIAYGRRLGPPEDIERRLQPDRARYVESVAAILGRTGQVTGSVEPVRNRARSLLARRAGLGRDPSSEQLRSAGKESGLDQDLIEALIDPEGDPITTGRALAALDRRK